MTKNIFRKNNKIFQVVGAKNCNDRFLSLVWFIVINFDLEKTAFPANYRVRKC